MLKGRAPLGSRIYYHREEGGVKRPTLLKREVIATGDQLVDATTTATQDGPGVSIRLNAQAGDEMLRTTQANLGKPMAVVLIEKTREKAVGRRPGSGARCHHAGSDQRGHHPRRVQQPVQHHRPRAGRGARAGAADAFRPACRPRCYVVSERPIGPSLGADNIDAGVRALLIGSVALFLFMIFYYHLFGVVASVVLLGNVVLLTALLSMMHASLSLPGIAGILLTVGMAVDANVIIYERIREELRNGVSPQTSIRAGFEKAFSAILDSNVTTAIAGLVLWVFGTGPIRSFAIVLTLGIATSMFTSLLGSRALLTLIYGGKHKPQRLADRLGEGQWNSFGKATSFPFMATRRIWYTLSIVLVIASLVLFFTRGLNLTIDFTGGTVVEATFPQAPSVDKVRTALEAAGFHEPTVQNFGTARDISARLAPDRRSRWTRCATRVTTALQERRSGRDHQAAGVRGPAGGRGTAQQRHLGTAADAAPGGSSTSPCASTPGACRWAPSSRCCTTPS